MDEMRHFHILSLGAGVQSTTLYLMAMDGDLEYPEGAGDGALSFDAAIFADTQEEPAAVYRHLEWLKSLGGPPIHVRTTGKLGEALVYGTTEGNSRFASIPAYTAIIPGQPLGILPRQCTSEYKIEVVDRFIRRELLGLKPRERMPKGVVIHQYLGFSTDEAGRASRTASRYRMLKGWRCHFPLFDEQMSRVDCMRYLEKRVPHPVPRSACVFCPYKSNREWRVLRDTDKNGWERACQIDDALRASGCRAAQGLEQDIYIHKSCRPLREAYLEDDYQELFGSDCEGGCGL